MNSLERPLRFIKRDPQASPYAGMLSVVIPFFGWSVALEATAKSLLAQSDPQLEIIFVVAGQGSELGAAAAMDNPLGDILRAQYRLRCLPSQHNTVVSLVQAGLKAAKGTYLSWLFEGDEFEIRSLQLVRESIGSNEGYSVICNALNWRFQPALSGYFVKRSASVLLGPLDESKGECFDLDYRLRIDRLLPDKSLVLPCSLVRSRLLPTRTEAQQKEYLQGCIDILASHTGFDRDLLADQIPQFQVKPHDNGQLAMQEYRDGAIVVKSTPRMLTIETTSRCNLKCVMCPHGIGAVNRPKHLEDDLADGLARFIRRSSHIQLHGIGEPLNSPSFWKTLNRIEPATDSSINTNLTVKSKDRLDELLDSNIGLINVSLDAVRPETYEKIRGFDLSVVLDNLQYLIDGRNSRAKGKRIYINMTLMKSNIDELVDFVELGARLGVNAVCVWHLNRWPDEEMAKYQIERDGWVFDYASEGLWNYPQLSDSTIQAAQARASTLGVNLIAGDNTPLFFGSNV